MRVLSLCLLSVLIPQGLGLTCQASDAEGRTFLVTRDEFKLCLLEPMGDGLYFRAPLVKMPQGMQKSAFKDTKMICVNKIYSEVTSITPPPTQVQCYCAFDKCNGPIEYEAFMNPVW